MKTKRILAMLMKIFLLGVLTSSLIAANNNNANNFEERNINDVEWSVLYVGQEICADEQNTTTFFYELTALSGNYTSGKAYKDLSHWVIDTNGYTVVSSSGGTQTQSVDPDPTTNLSGFKFDDGQDAGTTQSYSITVEGCIGEEDVSYAVKGGTYYAIGTTKGPGEEYKPIDLFTISGIIYLDTNSNGINNTEPSIANVTVVLYDENGIEIARTVTNENGYYEFLDLTNGNYNIEIPVNTYSNSVDFNEQLHSYLNTTGLVVNEIIIDGENVVADYGYNFDLSAVFRDLDSSDSDGNGIILADSGKTIGFWKHQHSVILRGKGKSQISEYELDSYLNSITTLHLDSVFGDINSNTKQESFNILSKRTNDANELLQKQLLATELNYVSNRGMLEEYRMIQFLLIAYGESLSANSELYTREVLLEVKDIFDTINNSGN